MEIIVFVAQYVSRNQDERSCFAANDLSWKEFIVCQEEEQIKRK